MKHYLIIIATILLSGCYVASDFKDQGTALCKNQGGLWYIAPRNTLPISYLIKCNNGAMFNADESLYIHDTEKK